MTKKSWWWISSVLSVILAAFIGLMWYIVDSRYSPNPDQLTDDATAEAFLQKELKKAGYPKIGTPIHVPTGVFIQSLNFNSASDVNITGYIWQKYPKDEPMENRGFVFPEAVDSGSNVEPDIKYRIIQRDQEVIGWYFEVTLRQRFNYHAYPLDHKTVWMRLWSKRFDRSAILIPDLLAYRETQPGDAFGIDKEIVLGSWDIKETFFDYKTVGYDTNFGIGDEISQKAFPELYFNIVIKRKFLNAFVINLIPLLTVIALLFAVMMTVTDDEQRVGKFGFDTSVVIGVCSALFFVVMLSHIQLREQFAASGIVYLEYFYLITYLVIIAVTVNTFLFVSGIQLRLIQYRDNLIPKLIFWPVILGVSVMITLVILF